MKFYSLLVIFFCKDFHINLVFFFVLVFHYCVIDHNTIREPDTNSTRFFFACFKLNIIMFWLNSY